MTLIDELRDKYTFIQRGIYQLKKHWFIVTLTIVSFWFLNRLDPVMELTMLSVSTAARLAVGLVIAELYWNFRFPKIGLQSAMLDNNLSGVLPYCTIILAAALV